jgi:alkylhydroperoxidase family enzyme
VKVLFVGEGRHDIGPADPVTETRAAVGTIPVLVRRACPHVSTESIALAWPALQRLGTTARGYAGKVAAAALVAARKHGCAAVVAVADADGDKERIDQLNAGAARAKAVAPNQRTVVGVAVQSIEAWTLGIPDAIAGHLGVSVDDVRREYKTGVEEMRQSSGKEEHRPKDLLDRLARLGHRYPGDCLEFRVGVAESADVDRLAQACPLGFKPFLDSVRRELASDS